MRSRRRSPLARMETGSDERQLGPTNPPRIDPLSPGSRAGDAVRRLAGARFRAVARRVPDSRHSLRPLRWNHRPTVEYRNAGAAPA